MVNVLLKEQVTEDIIGDRKLEEDGKYECDQYDKKIVSIFTSRVNMKGVRYECDKCEYKATCKSDITKHKQSMKELNMIAL